MLHHTSIWRGMRFRGLLEDMDSSCSTSFLIPARRNKCSRTILSWSRLRMDSPTLRAAQWRTWKDAVHVFLSSGALWSSLHSHYLLLFPFSHIVRRKAAHIGGLDFIYISQEGQLNPLLVRLDVLSWMFLIYGLGYVDDVWQIVGDGLLMSLNVMDQMIFVHRLKKQHSPWRLEIRR